MGQDQKPSAPTLSEWLRMGLTFFSAEELRSLLTMAERKLMNEHADIINKATQIRDAKNKLLETQASIAKDEDENAEEEEEDWDNDDEEPEDEDEDEDEHAPTMLPVSAIPTPDPALSVPKVIMHFVRCRRGGAKIHELLAFIGKHRPNKARTSVYSALHQLCNSKPPQLRKEGAGRNYTYYLAAAAQKGGPNAK